MTHEEFMKLQVGDVVRYGLKNYEVTEISDNITNIKNSMDAVIFQINKNDFRCSWKCYYSFSTANNYPISFCLNECSIIWKGTPENKLKKQIEQKKNELIQLENSLKELKEQEQKKELEEQLSKMNIGDFYTVKFDSGDVITGKYHARLSNQVILFYVHTNNEGVIISNCVIKNIKQIIHRPNFSNEYRILLKKIDTFNSDLKDA